MALLSLCWLAYLVVLSVLGIYGAHRLYLVTRYWLSHDSHTRPAEDRIDKPVVTVQVPLFNELNVAERVIAAVAALEWPRDRLQIQILDDSTDETRVICRDRVAALRREGFDIEHLHRGDRVGFKAGALASSLLRAKGSLILILDADFVPPPSLLRDAVGHFDDERVGMVQLRWEHLNRGHNLLTEVQALLLDGHFVVEQGVRAHAGKFFNFNGTAGIWRRDAILSAGNWQHDTLTEDLDLSYRALLKGWRFVYLGGVSAAAELPADMAGFKSQQFRWAKGSIQVARKLLPRVLRARVPLGVKLEAFFHLTQNVPYLLTFVLTLLAGPALLLHRSNLFTSPWIDAPLLLGTGITLAVYCLTSQRALHSRDFRRAPLAAIARVLCNLPVLVAVTVGISLSQARAVMEGLLGIESPFVRTPKYGITTRHRHGSGRKAYRVARTAMPMLELAMGGYCAAALAGVVWLGRWSAAPVFAVFALGFALVGVLTLRGPTPRPKTTTKTNGRRDVARW